MQSRSITLVLAFSALQSAILPKHSVVAVTLAPYGTQALTTAQNTSTPGKAGLSPAADFIPLASGSVQANSPAAEYLPSLAAAPPSSLGTALYSPSVYETATCNQTTPPASLSGWKRWSALSTWPGQSVVPGTNGTLSNVTVACGEFILYDMPPLQNGTSAVQLTSLLIEGHLMFLDDVSLPTLALSADHIVVVGNLTIGSSSQHFRQKAVITLTGISKTLMSGYEDVGFKVLAAAGGQLNLYGMPNGASTPSWVSLTQPAAAGDKMIAVDQDVSGWPVGAQVAIASTDFDAHQAETAVIVAASGRTLTLNHALQYSRFAPSVATGYNNISMPMAAEVALLSRNILITGSQEAGPQQLVGGHVIVYNTQAAQTFYGVEFSYLGQQGTLGRYPLHFHLCGPMPTSTVRSNSVHNSLQRAYVIHGTHWVTAQDNVAFNTTGHAFMFEDGIEQNNTLQHNLVINSKPATVLIPENPTNTDDTPSCFWSATPMNNWRNNTGVGCTSGFWLELNQAVRGVSASLPGASNINPYKSVLGSFVDNTAHSNQGEGLEMYQHGYLPPSNQTFLRFKAYKNSEYGMVFHGCMNVIVDQALIADSMTGVEFNEQSFNTLQNSVIIGQSANVGNPVNCSRSDLACEPLSGVCASGFDYNSVPNNPGPGYRTVPGDAKQGSARYGVVLAANTAAGNAFVNFNSTCLPVGAIGTDNIQPGAIPVTGLMRNNSFINTPVGSRAYIDPALGASENQYWAARDADGSTVGSAGYLVANGSTLLMPTPDSSQLCKNQTSWGGYSCQGVCYRSVFVQYNEPGLQSLSPQTGGTVLNVTRASDAASQIMPGGNMQANIQTGSNGSPAWNRLIYMNLLGGQNYNVTFQGGSGLLPSLLYFGFTDSDQPSSPACNASVNLAFPSGVQVVSKS